MKDGIAIAALVGALLVGVWGVFELWTWFSLVSEGHATMADTWPVVGILAVLVADAMLAVRLVGRIGDSHGA